MVSLLLPVQMKLSSPSALLPPVPALLLEDTDGVGVRVPDRKCRMPPPAGSVRSEVDDEVVVAVVATDLDWSMMVHSDSWTRLSSRSQNCTGFKLLQ